MRDDDHHAEQQHDRPDVDGAHRLVEPDGAGDDHQNGADDGDAGPIDTQQRYPPDCDGDVDAMKMRKVINRRRRRRGRRSVSRTPGTALRSLISSRNSIRVRALSRNAPSIALVTANEFCFSTPRIDMQRCVASMTTATPSGAILLANRVGDLAA